MTLFSFKEDFLYKIPLEIYASLVVFLVILIIAIYVKIKSKKVDPLAKPKGVMLLIEMGVEYIDGLVERTAGKLLVKNLGPYIGFCCMYLFPSFILGLFGLPSPLTFYIVPLTMALFTFILIHGTSIYYTRWKYFKRFVDPFPFFLPINLISMWAPLISLSFRMFGNAIAGWVLMELIYSVFQILSEALFGGLFLPVAAVVTPVLHAYFDLFSGFMQTTIFITLSMLFVNSEIPEDIDVNALPLEVK